MRIKGKEIKGPNIELIVIPRGDDEPIVLKAQAVLDFAEFDKFVPQPIPPSIRKPGGEVSRDLKDKGYVAQQRDYLEKQSLFMMIKSIMATDGLEFSKIKLEEPDTWNKFEEEFREAGFSFIEINKITSGIMIANCLNEAKLEEARKRFILSQAEEAKPE
jgi:hypothetical protein